MSGFYWPNDMKQKENLLAWKALTITVETGNITQTAHLLDVDSAKVSRLVSGLEKELGFDLLVKDHRPFVPTERCRQILTMVQPLLDGFNRLDEFCAGTAQKRLIRISAPVEMMQQFYSEELMQYSRLNPSIQFSMLPEMTVKQLLDGDTDIALVNHSPANQSKIVARHVVSNSTPIFATPQYLLEHGVPRNPEDLIHHTGLLQVMPNTAPTMILYKDGVASKIIQWGNVYLSHDQFLIRNLVLNHQGITPDLYLGHIIKELREGRIVPVMKGWERQNWNMHILARKDQYIEDSEIRNFMNWFSQIENRNCVERIMEARKAIEEAKANGLIPECLMESQE